MNSNTKIIIVTLVVVALFFFLVKKGVILRISKFARETRLELKKCSWPNRKELAGSTVIVLLVTAALGVFTVSADFVISSVIRGMNSLH